jgi:hypothetical protein
MECESCMKAPVGVWPMSFHCGAAASAGCSGAAVGMWHVSRRGSAQTVPAQPWVAMALCLRACPVIRMRTCFLLVLRPRAVFPGNQDRSFACPVSSAAAPPGYGPEADLNSVVVNATALDFLGDAVKSVRAARVCVRVSALCACLALSVCVCGACGACACVGVCALRCVCVGLALRVCCICVFCTACVCGGGCASSHCMCVRGCASSHCMCVCMCASSHCISVCMCVFCTACV